MAVDLGKCLLFFVSFFFLNDTATTEIYTLSLHDALPIRPVMLPSRTENEQSSSAVSPPNRLASPSSSRSGRGSAGGASAGAADTLAGGASGAANAGATAGSTGWAAATSGASAWTSALGGSADTAATRNGCSMNATALPRAR